MFMHSYRLLNTKIMMAAVTNEQIGVAALGLLVGCAFGVAFFRSQPTAKLVTAILAVILGGAPLAFLGDVPSKWIYPTSVLVGFVIGAFLSGDFRRRSN